MELKAHLSIPDSPVGNLIIVHENRGLDDHIRDTANRLAEKGFAVAAPDYLSPTGGSVLDSDTNISNIKNISREDVTSVSHYWLNVLSQLSQINEISMLGFCWGGGVVNHCATQFQSLNKAVIFYGMAPDLALVKNIKASMQLHYAEHDDRINSGRDEYHNILGKSDINFETRIYAGAKHAFFNDTRADRYHKESADKAFEYTVEFLLK